jgi:hypothetical protein
MADTDEERYIALKHAVADLGYVRRGSITRRLMPCGKRGCCCQASPPELHGPYYQWTRKVRGKTVTVRLTKEESQSLEAWIANARRLDKIIAAMEAVSMRVTQRVLRKQSKR